MPKSDRLASGKRKVKSFAFKCFRNSLAAINSLFIFIGLILIGIAAYGKKESILVSIPALGGVIACGVFLVLIAILGLIGAIRHNQIILFFYMLIMSLLFILLLAFSVAALAVTQGQQHKLMKKAWDKVDEKQKVKIEETFDCCGLDDGDSKRQCTGKTKDAGHCYAKIGEPLDKALSICGGVGLFFSFTLLLAVYLTVRYRNQKDLKMNADAFL